ncbi:hypothetical protein [Filimonas lacunae]|uniref:hypothetical protein n=1 Tax=Filimonas lacunae TaxID=477680 RepID=UPI0007D71237|nr:hypothetical protein [Filimonas lacunae]BAV08380.1 hypothetical protein FLA_4416 [Filimonas lacunae]
MTKEDVMNWAYHIIDQEEQPDIIIIDLVLSGSKSIQETYHYLGQGDADTIHGRPLLGLLHHQYKSSNFDLAKTIQTLYSLTITTNLNGIETNTIYYIEYINDDYLEGYVTPEELSQKIRQFLETYQHYTIYNNDQWPELDKKIDEIQAAAQHP